MHHEGHVGFNLILGSPVAYWLVSQGEFLLMALVTIGVVGFAVLPDIDMDIHSVTHRGITHSIWFGMAAGAIYGGILAVTSVSELSWLAKFALGFASATVGIMGHNLADMLTPMGIAPFEPLSSWYRGFGFCRAGNQYVNESLFKLGVVIFSITVVVGTVGIHTIIDPFIGSLSTFGVR